MKRFQRAARMAIDRKFVANYDCNLSERQPLLLNSSCLANKIDQLAPLIKQVKWNVLDEKFCTIWKYYADESKNRITKFSRKNDSLDPVSILNRLKLKTEEAKLVDRDINVRDIPAEGADKVVFDEFLKCFCRSVKAKKPTEKNPKPPKPRKMPADICREKNEILTALRESRNPYEAELLKQKLKNINQLERKTLLAHPYPERLYTPKKIYEQPATIPFEPPDIETPPKPKSRLADEQLLLQIEKNLYKDKLKRSQQKQQQQQKENLVAGKKPNELVLKSGYLNLHVLDEPKSERRQQTQDSAKVHSKTDPEHRVLFYGGKKEKNHHENADRKFIAELKQGVGPLVKKGKPLQKARAERKPDEFIAEPEYTRKRSSKIRKQTQDEALSKTDQTTDVDKDRFEKRRKQKKDLNSENQRETRQILRNDKQEQNEQNKRRTPKKNSETVHKRSLAQILKDEIAKLKSPTLSQYEIPTSKEKKRKMHSGQSEYQITETSSSEISTRSESRKRSHADNILKRRKNKAKLSYFANTRMKLKPGSNRPTAKIHRKYFAELRRITRHKGPITDHGSRSFSRKVNALPENYSKYFKSRSGSEISRSKPGSNARIYKKSVALKAELRRLARNKFPIRDHGSRSLSRKGRAPTEGSKSRRSTRSSRQFLWKATSLKEIIKQDRRSTINAHDLELLKQPPRTEAFIYRWKEIENKLISQPIPGEHNKSLEIRRRSSARQIEYERLCTTIKEKLEQRDVLGAMQLIAQVKKILAEEVKSRKSTNQTNNKDELGALLIRLDKLIRLEPEVMRALDSKQQLDQGQNIQETQADGKKSENDETDPLDNIDFDHHDSLSGYEDSLIKSPRSGSSGNSLRNESYVIRETDFIRSNNTSAYSLMGDSIVSKASNDNTISSRQRSYKRRRSKRVKETPKSPPSDFQSTQMSLPNQLQSLPDVKYNPYDFHNIYRNVLYENPYEVKSISIKFRPEEMQPERFLQRTSKIEVPRISRLAVKDMKVVTGPPKISEIQITPRLLKEEQIHHGGRKPIEPVVRRKASPLLLADLLKRSKDLAKILNLADSKLQLQEPTSRPQTPVKAEVKQEQRKENKKEMKQPEILPVETDIQKTSNLCAVCAHLNRHSMTPMHPYMIEMERKRKRLEQRNYYTQVMFRQCPPYYKVQAQCMCAV